MKALVVLAHPYEKSFNHAIFRAASEAFAARGVEVFSHDLYADGFNPVLTREELGKRPTSDPLALRYTRELLASDVLVFVHPNWWGQPPAILKGYIDRVIRPPHAYDFPENDSGGGLPIGKLAGKRGLVFNTSNTEESRENGYFGDPLESTWIKCVFGFCGITETSRKVFRVVADSDEATRAAWLSEVRAAVDSAIDG